MPAQAIDATDMTLSLPAVPESVAHVRHALRAFVTQNCPDMDAGAVALAVTEAATNVVVHAYRDRDGERGSIHVRAWFEEERLRVGVADEGTGMRPRADSPGLGLGVPLMATLATSFELCPGPGGRGNEVRLTFDAGSRDVALA